MTTSNWREELRDKLYFEVMEDYLHHAELKSYAEDPKAHMEMMRGYFDKLLAFIEKEIEAAKQEERDAIVEKTREANEVLRSAYQIARREGKDTNWDSWGKRLETILQSQHVELYGHTYLQTSNKTV